jgi:hypothetical protein
MDAVAALWAAELGPQRTRHFCPEQQSKGPLKHKAFFGSPSPIKPQRIGGRIHSRLRVGIMAAACIFLVGLIRPGSSNEF